MKLSIDKKADALYLKLDESKIVDTLEVSPGVVLFRLQRIEASCWGRGPLSLQAHTRP